jgi:uncharacterized phage protein gp47/JayE
MAFQRPTLNELVDRIQQDFVSRLSLVGAVLRRSVVFVWSRVMAGAAHMLHGHLDFLSRQMFPDLSEGSYLVRQAGLFGLSRLAATFADGPITITGVNGAVIPAGVILKRSDGAEYTVNADATIALGTASAQVTAKAAGANSNADAGVSLTFESPIAGVDSAALVATGGLVGGTDQEADAGLRARLLDRMRNPPHGGAAADYVAWAKEIAGVTRAWVYPLELGAGTVTVRFVRDDDASIIPDVGEVADVQAHIDSVRPVTAAVTVAAPIADPLGFTIQITPDTTATRAAVTAELTDLIRRDAEPGGTILLSQIETAIGVAEGVTNFVITLPAGNVTHATGHMATMGIVTFT